MNARELALNVLYKIEIGEAYSNTSLDKELNKSELSKVEKSLASELVYGVITWKITLDEIIKMYSKVRIKKISPWIINILRLGIYQIVYLDKIPISAAVNESVKLSKKYGHTASANFVNAILRKIEKNECEKLMDYLKTKPLTDEEMISIFTSHPIWIVEKLLKDYEKKFVLEFLNSNNIVPETTIRVNTLKNTREEVKKLFDLKGIDSRLGKLQDSIIIKNLNVFDSQVYVVQDEAAQLVCLKLDPKENEYILDACAAPGGKTTYLAALMNNKGRIDAWDIHEHRVKLIEDTAKKVGATIIKTKVKDSKEYDTLKNQKYDRILLDVPCSGIGVIRKKPDIKWTRKEEDIKELVSTQKEILNTCSKYLKNNGTLVYSTCTVFKDENENQINDFLKKNKEFRLKEEIHLFPNVDGTDGFYIAVIVKNEE